MGLASAGADSSKRRREDTQAPSLPPVPFKQAAAAPNYSVPPPPLPPPQQYNNAHAAMPPHPTPTGPPLTGSSIAADAMARLKARLNSNKGQAAAQPPPRAQPQYTGGAPGVSTELEVMPAYHRP